MTAVPGTGNTTSATSKPTPPSHPQAPSPRSHATAASPVNHASNRPPHTTKGMMTTTVKIRKSRKIRMPQKIRFH